MIFQYLVKTSNDKPLKAKKSNFSTMKKTSITELFLFFLFLSNVLQAEVRTEIVLTDNWKFQKGKADLAYQKEYDDSKWESVTVPHDWAIYGPFDKEIDKQSVAIDQNGEKVASEKTGRTGALPYIGEGWYRNQFTLPDYKKGQKVLIVFEGAMSEPTVYINGEKVGEWAYGYSYFYFDITKALAESGKNTVSVHLNNRPMSSRWYPGAGLYRKVSLVIKESENISQWGTYITTPLISKNMARVNIKTKVNGENLRIETTILDASGKTVAQNSSSTQFANEFDQNIKLEKPNLWSPETPYLYTAVTKLYSGDMLKDEVRNHFGVREIKYEPNKGFSLNGQVRKFKGVCLHHDLGPLGTAINVAALRRQLTILKEMGCDAIRSSHNMPSIEQLELCDEMGFMFLAESFDEWAKPKVQNGYHLFFDDYAERDIVNLVHATRNHPCVVMWSAGNEVPDQFGQEGVKLAKWLQDVFHREDPTRPVTVGMNQVQATMSSGFGALLDIPGLNYRVNLYDEAFNAFPQGFILGSETASTVSSRGVYKFPVVEAKNKQYVDHQCSSYDLEACSWSNVPDVDFVEQDDKPWVIGEFVWTGFDYLGEPTPYDEVWPARSSYFGINDLAGLPKDRYYLYRSRWNKKEATLHLLPHWNWKGREGQITPVFAYTSYNSAELFVNGKNMGIRHKNDSTIQNRYRLMWMNVKYEPGTLKIVAFDKNGAIAATEEIRTAGEPYRIVLESDRTTLKADGNDISFVTVSVVDKNGIPCPTGTNQLNFTVEGNGKFRAVCNGDATSLELFQLPTMKLFSGKLVVLVQSNTKIGDIKLTVKGNGLKSGEVNLKSL